MSALWIGVLAHLWQTTIVLALLGGLALALKRAPARYQEWLWTAALAKVMVPIPLIAAYWPAISRLGRSVDEPMTVGPAIQVLSQLTNPGLLRIPPPAPEPTATAPAGLVVVTTAWAVGVALLLAFWWIRSRVPVPEQQEPWHASDTIVERLGRAARAAGVPLNRIRLTRAAIMPCVRNLRRPVLVISTAVVENLSIEELRAVLVHEEAHRRRADLWRAAASAAATCLFFFYPPVWWLRRRLRDAAELACDESVLAAGIDPGTYSRALATTVSLGLAAPGPASLAARNSLLRERLGRIREPHRYTTMRRHRFAVLAAFILAFAISFIPVADGRPLAEAIGEPQDPGASVRAITTNQEAALWVSAADIVGLSGIETTIDLNLVDTSVVQILGEVGRQGGFEIWLAPDADLTLTASVGVNGVSVRDVLELLEDLGGLQYRVVGAAHLAVGRRGGRMVGREPEETIQDLPEYPGVIRLTGSDKPEKVHHVNPEYPDLARRARLEGYVILDLVVDGFGNVTDAHVLRGVGLGLDDAALEAVRQWRFTPTYYNGMPVDVVFTVNVQFQLIR